MTERPLSSSSKHLYLHVGLGPPHGRVLNFRVSPDAADELKTLLREQTVYSRVQTEQAELSESVIRWLSRSEQSSGAVHMSATRELVIVAGSFAGGLGGLAAVLRAFLNRNQHKSITVSLGDEMIELKGMSQKETDALIDRLLEEAHKRQREQDELDVQPRTDLDAAVDRFFADSDKRRERDERKALPRNEPEALKDRLKAYKRKVEDDLRRRPRGDDPSDPPS